MKVLHSSKKELGIPYLSLQVDSQTQIALPMENAQEVIVIPTESITPIPNMSNHIIGLLNQRSRIFWVIDLGRLLGVVLKPPESKQYNIAILKVSNIITGLMVEKIKGVVRIKEEQIESPIGVISPSITPYLKGCVMSSEGMLLILDAETIINSSILNE